ncbi:MAG TPA: malto-oligosyltrehalose synthase [Dehalococcoidia bacterium]|nr:malto-oligosyltrehalose synthase [Dehalococcoidia bacterium]
MAAPGATYRIQFNSDFTLRDARRLVPYLRDLGITHLYASPVLTSRQGSTHGYDVADPATVDREIGSEEEWAALADELREAGLSVMLDIVPNHMAASIENPWWRDVLARGQESEYARYFDIDWDAKGGKVLLPVLGESTEDALAAGSFRIEGEGEAARLCYFATELPLAAGSFEGGEVTAEVLERQHYRLEHWESGAQRLNYRRFFDITELVSLREEDPEVFARAHERVLAMMRNQRISALRVDHIDGLRDPADYLWRLQARSSEAGGGGESFYVLIEKILAPDEELPAEWPVAGTTGYDFLNLVNGLYIDPDGLERLDALYREVTGQEAPFEKVAREAKLQVMRDSFAGEMESLAGELVLLAAAEGVMLTLEEARGAIEQVTAGMPVYRTYTNGAAVSERDVAVVERAFEGVEDGAVAGFLRRVLLLDREDVPAGWLRFVMRWQQFTGPIMAKGVEDTAFYRYNRLLSANEVGGEPGSPLTTVERLHASLANRRLLTMNAATTHDTKRSEDARARLNVLSEITERWAACVRGWRGRAERAGTGIEANDAYALYQLLYAAWPLDGPDQTFRERMHGVLEKSLREAKRRTSWGQVDEGYEGDAHGHLDESLDDEAFCREMEALVEETGVSAAVNSLSQLVIKLTAPGVPDTYQGCELWENSLVDPDNRRPVDFDARMRMLNGLSERVDAAELLRNWQDGRIKAYVTRRGLEARARYAAAFALGGYLPLVTEGEDAGRVVAFARVEGAQWLITVAPRLTWGVSGGEWPLGEAWGDTAILLPDYAPDEWRDVLTGAEVDGSQPRLRVADVLRDLPVALLTCDR